MSLIKLIPDTVDLEIPEATLTMNVGIGFATVARTIDQIEGLYWQVVFYPAGKTVLSSRNVSVFVSVSKPVSARYTLALKNTGICSKHHTDFQSVLTAGSPFFVSHTELRRNGAIQNGNFEITCNIEFEMPVARFDGVPSIRELLHESCPQILFFVGGKTIKMNKAILISVSPVFNAMFSHDTKEAQTGSVTIEDFDFGTVENAVNFCLGSVLDRLTTEECLELLKFADKYDIKGLTLYLEAFLVNHTTFDNVGDVFTYASTCSSNILINKCATMVANNCDKSVLNVFAGLEPTVMASLVKAAANLKLQ